MIKRIAIWSVAVILALAGLTYAAFKVSPWPSVLVIRYAFSKGDKASEAALEKHVPKTIESRRSLAYGDGPDDIFDIYYPKGMDTPRQTIVWIHGGGWIGGSKDGVANYLKVLAGHGYTTVGLEYSTGVGGTYPKPVEQVSAAITYLVHHAAEYRIDPNRIVLAGDSAGAQIAGQVALVVTDPSYARKLGVTPPAIRPEQLKAMLLVSGAYDLGTLHFDGEFSWFLRTVLWAYSGEKDFLNDPRFRLLSVTPHASAAFPPSFITSGNGDPLEHQARELVERLGRLGVRTDALFFAKDHAPALPHEYQFNLDTPEGREALERILAFLDPSGPGKKTAATRVEVEYRKSDP